MNKVLIIAEAGINHNGDLNIAKKLALTAKECGADIVKYQTAKLDSLVTKSARMADYQVANTGSEVSQKEMLEKLLLSFDEFVLLADYCKEIGIKFLSTPFDIESVHFLNDMQDIWKIPSGEITNYPYLVEIANTHKDVILSTGMSTLSEVESAVKLLSDEGAGKISLLHCTTQYPAPYDSINLNAMITLKEKIGLDVGYSDHTNGIEIPVAAVAMGAVIIEKHFTLDRNMEGPDHKASLEPEELRQMVQAIRHVESAFGNGQKVPVDAEKENMNIARKSIVAKRFIRKGECFTEDNITTKRPGNGVNPMLWKSVLGTKAIRDFAEDELIETDN